MKRRGKLRVAILMLSSPLLDATHSCLGDAESSDTPPCPNCARSQGVVREIRQNNLQFAHRHDLFLAEVQEHSNHPQHHNVGGGGGGFSVVAGAFAKGVMDLTNASGDAS